MTVSWRKIPKKIQDVILYGSEELKASCTATLISDNKILTADQIQQARQQAQLGEPAL